MPLVSRDIRQASGAKRGGGAAVFIPPPPFEFFLHSKIQKWTSTAINCYKSAIFPCVYDILTNLTKKSKIFDFGDNLAPFPECLFTPIRQANGTRQKHKGLHIYKGPLRKKCLNIICCLKNSRTATKRKKYKTNQKKKIIVIKLQFRGTQDWAMVIFL